MGNQESKAKIEMATNGPKHVTVLLVFIVSAASLAEARYSGGIGEPNDPYRIATAEDLNDIGNHVEDFNKCFVLVNDIDLAGYTGRQFNMIGTWIGEHDPNNQPFTGVFDGNGHSIYSFTYEANEDFAVGLFSFVVGRIENLTLVDANIYAPANSRVGSLVGYLFLGTVSSCCSRGADVTGYISVGGLVGRAFWNCVISDSCVTGNVSGTYSVGGLTGLLEAGVIDNCRASAIVSGDSSLGGLAGANQSGGHITNSCATGDVSGNERVGGLVGDSGRFQPRSITEGCYATGDVSGTGEVGGLLGKTEGDITNSYATGSVSGTHEAGGLVGQNGYRISEMLQSPGYIDNCYSAGLVFGTGPDIGGLTGINEVGEITESFWDVESSGQASSAGGTGKTTAEMMTESTFSSAGWDFNTPVWTICGFGGNYPRLWWQEPRVYYVNAADGNDQHNGSTAATAFATIQAGIDVALGCEEVLVRPAVYSEKLDFLGKAIAVQGVATGEGLAIIEAANDIGVSFYSGEDGNSVLENFVLRSSETAVLLADASPSLRQLTVVDNNYGIAAYGDSEPNIRNCILWDNASGDLYGCEARYSCIEQSGAGEGNIDTDPLFADANGGDYHLLSKYGRYWLEHGVWVFDEVTSGCIDGGSPNVGPWDEPIPNGDRINMGCYGGTSYASMSEWPAQDGIYPVDRADDICPWAIINWPQAEYVVDHNVYFGSSLSDVNSSAAAVAEHSEPNGWIVGDLELNTIYYWRIDGVNDANADSPWVGLVRQFTTNDGNAFDPYPADGQLGVSPEATLSWAPGCLADSHEVYFSTDFDAVSSRAPAAYMGAQIESTFEPFGLDYYRWYYWCVDEVSGVDVWNGKVWAFRTAYATMDPDLIVWYEFDETAGDIAHDASGYARDGYVDGQNNWDPNDGRFGGCLVFDDDTAVEVPTTVLSDLNDGITISVWLKEAYREDSDNWVFDTGSGDYHVQAAVVEQSTGQAMWRAGNDSNDVLIWDLDGADPSTVHGWHHWVFIKDESTGNITLYFDGMLVALDDVVDSTLTNVRNTPFKIGAVTWHVNDFVGRMDDFQIWGRALSESDILSLFRGGCIGRCEDLECSWSPTPRDVSVDVPPDAELQWKPGDSAVAHDVYFGTDESAVSDADTVQPLGVYMGRQDLEADSFDPCGLLEFGTTYYWRVDEVNEPNVWKCHIWSFTTANFLVVDDFESYDERTNRIYHTWEDGALNWSGSFIDLGTDPFHPVHGGDQSMLFMYDNSIDWGFGYYSEAGLPFGGPQDWTGAGVKALGLWFYGDGDNDVNDTEELYVALRDRSGIYAEYWYRQDAGGDMNDLKLQEWTEWNIAISSFSLRGVDPCEVAGLFIGFGDRDNTTVPGGDGVVYFDDIRLYPPRCVAELGPAADLNGDCAVDYEDLEIMAEQWLCSGSCTADLYPDNEVDLKDYAMLAASWLEDQLWP